MGRPWVPLAALGLATVTHCAVGLALRQQGNPIRKVIGLMQDMQKEIEAEKEKEKALFEKFMCICTEYPSELQETIDDDTKQISELSGKLESEKAEQAKLELEVKGHNSEKASAEEDLSKATELRQKEQAEYNTTAASAQAAIAGLEKALPLLEEGGSKALLQADVIPNLEASVKSTTVLSAWQKNQVTSFLGSGESAGDSGEIVGILKQMLGDMKTGAQEALKAEEVAAGGFEQLKKAKDEEIAVAAEAIEGKSTRVGTLATSIAESTDAMEDATTGKADAEKMLKTLTEECGTKKKEWEARLKVREDEITAISEAIAILNDDDALDVFKKAIPAALLQGGGKPAAKAGLLQTRHVAATGALSAVQGAVRRASEAQEWRSSRVAHLNALMARGRAAAREPELEQIPQDMIQNLEKQKTDDTKKKEFCTSEIEKAEAEEKSKQDGLDAVNAAITEINDDLASFDDEVAAIQKEINEIDKSVAQATEQRKAEHAEYAETLQMTDVAIELLGKAKNRLLKFYQPELYKAPPKTEKSMEDKIAESYGFVQRHAHGHGQPEVPALPDLPKYEKKNSGGVVALMDKLVMELKQDKIEAEHEEKTSQHDYVELMKESGETRGQSEKALVEKKASKADLEMRLTTAKEESKSLLSDLMNSHTLTEGLHKTCDFLLKNFQARDEARTKEEESLKEAKAVLHSLKE